VEENENNTIACDALVVLVPAGDPMVVAQTRCKDKETVFFDGATDLSTCDSGITACHPGRSVADIGVVYLAVSPELLRT
jgi:hypothetical protein